MEHLASKSYLGLALAETLEELAQPDLQEDMQALMASVFARNMKEVMAKADPRPVEIRAEEDAIKEAPFGLHMQNTNLILMCNQVQYSGSVEFLNSRGTVPTCVEAFSDNKEKASGKMNWGHHGKGAGPMIHRGWQKFKRIKKRHYKARQQSRVSRAE